MSATNMGEVGHPINGLDAILKRLDDADGAHDTDGGTELGEWDAGTDKAPIYPRAWLLGNVFCRRFLSSLIAAGGTGKTALRIAQYLALASGKPITGEHVFRRCRVLVISLEDDAEELRRRVRAAMLHHGVSPAEVAGYLYLAAPVGSGWRLATSDASGKIIPGSLEPRIADAVRRLDLDLVALDPFVKSHAVEENANGAIDHVATILTRLAVTHNIAVDVPHHVSKGAADAGNADRGRGASAFKDAARLVYTLTAMTEEEAKGMNITEADRRFLVRVDSAKVNIAPPAKHATWFRLIGVPLLNGTDEYPNGDEVQTVEPWTAPDTWAGLSSVILNQILTDIDAGMENGQRYSSASAAGDRAAWRVVEKHCSTKSEAQCREIIKTWLQNGVLVAGDYEDPIQRHKRSGLRANSAKRPS